MRRNLVRWAKQLAIALVVWSGLAVVYAFEGVRMMRVMDDRVVPLWQTLRPALETFWIYALLTPPTIELSRRLRFGRGQATRLVLTHAAGFSGFVIAQAILRVLIFPMMNQKTGVRMTRSWDLVYNTILVFFNDDLFTYFPIVGTAMAYTANLRERQRELSESKLNAQLASAELQILKMQLHPHFLFNTLQAISTLVGKDPQAARKMIALLGGLLRATIDRRGEQEVPLREELELLDRYVQIELVRFGDKLRVDFDMADASLGALVPALMLQPLVENAIRHGARSVAGPAAVRVSSVVLEEKLILTIEDDGPGLRPDVQKTPGGLGLENTRARLRHLYGADQRLELANRESGGLRVTMEIPVRLQRPAR